MHEQTSSPTTHDRRLRRVVVTTGLVVGLTAGGFGVASAATTPTPAPSSSTGAGATTPDATARAARVPHLDGQVTAVTSDSVTLTDRDGFTRTVLTSGTTTWTLDGADADSSAVATGLWVRAEGPVASDGTSLDATEVAVLSEEPTGRAGGGGRGGDRGPRGDTDGTTAHVPSGTATPDASAGAGA